jgi:lambda family phage portal protein
VQSIPQQLRSRVVRQTIKEYKVNARRRAEAAKYKKRVERAFAGASQSRLYADWLSTSATTNEEIQNSQPRVLNRGRELARDDANVKKFLRMVDKGIVHTGFRLQSTVVDSNGEPDEAARRAIERMFKKWSMKGVCTTCGKFSFRQAHRKMVRTKARDGEYFVRKHLNYPGNEFGFALQLIPVETLDWQFNKRLSNGNIVIMGVELNADNRPVAYHFWEEVPSATTKHNPGNTLSKRQRISADQIIHSFIDEFEENQIRGITWLHAAMKILKQYGGFMEAEVIAARIAACKHEYYEVPAEYDEEELKKINPPGTMEPGSSEIGAPGVKKSILSPTHPAQGMGENQKAFKRDIASAADVAYNTLANDLERVNLSSLRYGVEEDRDTWRMLAGDEVDDLLENIFPDLLENALIRGKVTLLNGQPLPLVKFDKFLPHIWQSRGWKFMDPVKDANAAKMAVEEGWTTNAEVTAERGGDWDTNMDIALREDARKRERAAANGGEIDED